MTVDHNSDKVKTTRIGFANGVAVYAPNTTCRFQFNLNKIPGVDFAPNKLSITYSTSSDVSRSGTPKRNYSFADLYFNEASFALKLPTI
jgi:hypothetical protein